MLPSISLSVSLDSCSPLPAVLVVKKPGGDDMVLDLPADFETVSGIDDEKYALCVTCHVTSLQCFDAVGWAAGRASSL